MSVSLRGWLWGLFGAGLSLAVQAQTIIPAPPAIDAKGYLLIDADSGQVLVEHNADTRLPPASLTKLMTSYVLSYELAEGRVHKDDLVTVSRNAWAQNPLFNGSSLMWIEVGKQVPLAELHKGIVIASGNDASVAVAEHLAGSESAFADVMNQHAQLLGMSNSHFVNAHGLPHPDHYTTPRDLATLSRELINRFPEDYALYQERTYTYNGITQSNRNELLGFDPSVDGLKTGHTDASGYCLVASAKREGMRLISVVMGTDSRRARKQESAKLINYGFRFFETHRLYQAGQILQQVTVWSGMKDQVSLSVPEDLFLTLPRGQKDALEAKLVVDEVIHAPIQVGQALGELVVSLEGKELLRAPLRATETVEQAGLFKRLWHTILLFFKGLVA